MNNGKIWYEEVKNFLKDNYLNNMSWDDLIHLRDNVEEKMWEIRKKEGYQEKIKYCHCGAKMILHKEPTINSIIYGLGSIKVLKFLDVEELSKDWKKYQRKNKLDGCGKLKELVKGHIHN